MEQFSLLLFNITSKIKYSFIKMQIIVKKEQVIINNQSLKQISAIIFKYFRQSRCFRMKYLYDKFVLSQFIFQQIMMKRILSKFIHQFSKTEIYQNCIFEFFKSNNNALL
ncbi:unnamed protein product [Paramecium pentaurelia]|uniref:Uncharacterized protein n=1 Tax=Paramecium pentaurelia TaxID=43138 RepID=A0A8S1VAL9_9CILI|nr:unnamed protein product [Paramecium pentaurelia]